ncbi:hypothetical protein Rsub_10831 [Raphidocelis subcapitata]|uniref:tRNA threonylcarbamoyladenosine biosynthesis protein TsaE n=1 Tax=Raphidocelis subcapitata TaxID=307507 RepID=A0A2V0PHY3_9CHLO|nr:hypothetical protein Rsub_10831 [Raphidocelis subcapitata]|eukprot:GBF98642.1 hypothetical protein Rsub_10831 [Raphidocelis subcapitata]
MQATRCAGHARHAGCVGAARRHLPPVAPQRRQERRQIASVRAFAGVPDWNGRCFVALSTGEAATSHLARLIAEELNPGDSLCLKGDKGAGKSLFAREFIRSVYSDPQKEVHPPAQSLASPSAAYGDHAGPPIQHLDLRPMAAPSDADRQALLESFESRVSLVECAERLQEWGAAPEQRLAIWIRRLPEADGAGGNDGAGASVRVITVVPHTGAWELRAGLLHAAVSRTGAPQGLLVLGDEMGASMIKGLPEGALLAKAA